MNIEAEERLKLNAENKKRNSKVNKKNIKADLFKKDEKEREWDEEKDMNWMLERGKEVREGAKKFRPLRP